MFIGLFKNDEISKGTMMYASQTLYQGNFKDGKRNGYGKLTTEDGQIFEGEWTDDELVSEGKVKYRGLRNIIKISKSDFEKVTAKGTYEFENGYIYEGNWVNDKLEGKGRKVYPDGREFHGEFKDGKEHGKGEMTLANGEKLKGVWENGILP